MAVSSIAILDLIPDGPSNAGAEPDTPVSNQASFSIRLGAIGAGGGTSLLCALSIVVCSEGAGDSLTVGTPILRPQYVSDPAQVVFTNHGGVTINSAILATGRCMVQ
ncbi:MAG: hypothetical protein IPO81_21450 [Kouleothrix sp.]|nr:hypothetical protein [Kouleothrix sp.]